MWSYCSYVDPDFEERRTQDTRQDDAVVGLIWKGSGGYGASSWKNNSGHDQWNQDYNHSWRTHKGDWNTTHPTHNSWEAPPAEQRGTKRANEAYGMPPSTARRQTEPQYKPQQQQQQQQQKYDLPQSVQNMMARRAPDHQSVRIPGRAEPLSAGRTETKRGASWTGVSDPALEILKRKIEEEKRRSEQYERSSRDTQSRIIAQERYSYGNSDARLQSERARKQKLEEIQRRQEQDRVSSKELDRVSQLRDHRQAERAQREQQQQQQDKLRREREALEREKLRRKRIDEEDQRQRQMKEDARQRQAQARKQAEEQRQREEARERQERAAREEKQKRAREEERRKREEARKKAEEEKLKKRKEELQAAEAEDQKFAADAREKLNSILQSFKSFADPHYVTIKSKLEELQKLPKLDPSSCSVEQARERASKGEEVNQAVSDIIQAIDQRLSPTQEDAHKHFEAIHKRKISSAYKRSSDSVLHELRTFVRKQVDHLKQYSTRNRNLEADLAKAVKVAAMVWTDLTQARQSSVSNAMAAVGTMTEQNQGEVQAMATAAVESLIEVVDEEQGAAAREELSGKLEEASKRLTVLREKRERIERDKIAAEAALQSTFAKYDVDSDGVLSRLEVAAFAQGELNVTLLDRHLDTLMRSVGNDNSGVPLPKFQQLKVKVGVIRESIKEAAKNAEMEKQRLHWSEDCKQRVGAVKAALLDVKKLMDPSEGNIKQIQSIEDEDARSQEAISIAGKVSKAREFCSDTQKYFNEKMTELQHVASMAPFRGELQQHNAEIAATLRELGDTTSFSYQLGKVSENVSREREARCRSLVAAVERSTRGISAQCSAAQLLDTLSLVDTQVQLALDGGVEEDRATELQVATRVQFDAARIDLASRVFKAHLKSLDKDISELEQIFPDNASIDKFLGESEDCKGLDLPAGCVDQSSTFSSMRKQYKCVIKTVMHACLPLSGKPIRRITVGDIVAGLAEPVPVPGNQDIMRVKCRIGDAIGFVTVKGNRGGTFLEEINTN